MKTNPSRETIDRLEQRARELRRETLARLVASACMSLRQAWTRTLLRVA